MTAVLSSSPAGVGISPDATFSETASGACRTVPTVSVSAVLPSLEEASGCLNEEALRGEVTPEALEVLIRACGLQMQVSMKRWETDGFFADAGEAHRWKDLMYEAIRLRSPEKVAEMEKARGLA
jgi:hypothetical protein